MKSTIKNWQHVRLRDICELRYGKSLPDAKRNGGQVPVYGSNGVVGYHDEAITNGPTIIVGRKGSLGEVIYCPTKCWPIDTTYYIDSSATDADLGWLTYCLRQLRLTEMNKAAAIPGLNRDDAYAKSLLLPPLEEQQRIAAILDKADTIRNKKRQAIKLSNQLIESGFLHYFGDCLNNGKNFSTGTLEQLAGRIVDCPHSTPQYSETGTGYFCVRSSDIQDAQINLSQTRFVTSETYEDRVARHVPQAGEVIYTREGGRLGNAAQIPANTKICLGQRMMLFSAKDKVSTNEFIWALLNSLGIRHQVDSLIAGAAAPRINIADIRRLEVILPPFELQQQFSWFVQKVRDQRMKSSKSEDELSDLFNSLVQRAFRGEL